MAQAANIVINDGAPTPAAHTFSPQSVGLLTANYRDRSVGVIIGQPSIDLSKEDPKSAAGVYTITARVQLPILEVSAPSTGSGYQPQPKVAYTVTGNLRFLVPQRSAQTDRAYLLAFCKNLLAHATMVSAIEDLEMPW